VAVDSFLRALADDSADEAIGVVLSGNGSDGALGIAAIKAAGGVTFAQDPQAARFDGMPQAAIGLGDVDFVLAAAEIGQRIALMGKDPLALRHAVEQGEVPERDEIKAVLKALNSATGIDLSYYKPANLKSAHPPAYAAGPDCRVRGLRQAACRQAGRGLGAQ
jgi:two-component system CheB/CheR fusion protein